MAQGDKKIVATEGWVATEIETEINGALQDITALEADVDSLKDLRDSSQDPTGFDRHDITSFPIIEFCKDATVGYVRIAQDGSYSEIAGTTWEDGSALVINTYCIRPADTETDYSFFFNGIKHTITDAKYIALPNTNAGVKFLVLNKDENLEFATSAHDAIVDKVIVSIVYHNGVEVTLVADERHGKEMNSIDHERIHLTQGAIFEQGYNPLGFVATNTAYTQIGAGIIWDEDIKVSTQAQTTIPHYYKSGTNGAWFHSTEDLNFAHLNGVTSQYNQNNNGTWQLTDIGAGEFGMTHFMVTNDAKYPIYKVMGQKTYIDISTARADIGNQIRLIEGLPLPEFVILYSVIYDSNGELEEVDSSGNVYTDFRFLNGAGVGGSSAGVSIHNDLGGRSNADSHPITAVTGLRGELDTLAAVDAVPIGVITMWSGSVTSIPSKWALCDGANGTPDLRERFVMGVTDDAGVNNVGGSKDAVVISHNHSASSGGQSHNHYHSNNHNHGAAYTSSDNHNHNNGTTGGGAAAVYGQEAVTERTSKIMPTEQVASNANLTSSDSHYHSLNLPNYTGSTGYVSHNHTHAITVNANGVAGTDLNLPPYMKLAYIMKVA